MRERALRLVLDPEGQHPSRWLAIVPGASKIGCTRQTLHDWVSKAEVDSGKRPGPAPNILWVSDVTAVATWTEFVYVTFVIDA